MNVTVTAIETCVRQYRLFEQHVWNACHVKQLHLEELVVFTQF